MFRPIVQLVLLTLAALSVVYTRFSLGPLQEAFRADLGLSDNQIALLQGTAIALPMALISVPIGAIADRYSRALIVKLCAALVAIVMALTIWTNRLEVLFFSRMLVGCAYGAVLVAAYSAVGDLFGPAIRGRATTVVAMGENVAAPIAFAAGGLLLTWSAASPELLGASGWRWALLWMSLPVILISFAVLPLREPVRRGRSTVSQPITRSALKDVWRARAIVFPLLFARIMVWIADGAAVIWAAPAFERRFGASSAEVGAIMAAALLFGCTLGTLIGGPLADWCERRAGPRGTMQALSWLALLSVPAAAFPMLPTTKAAGIGLGFLIMFGYTIGVASLALAINVIPAHIRGIYLGLTITVGSFFSIGVSPVVVSILSQMLGGPEMIGTALCAVCVLTSILGAVTFFSSRRFYPSARRAAAEVRPVVVDAFHG